MFYSLSLEMIDNIFTLKIIIIHPQTLNREFYREEGRTDNRISPESLLCLSTFVTASPRKPWGMSEPNKILEVKLIFRDQTEDRRHPLNKFNFTIFSILTTDFNIEHSLLNNIHRFSIFQYSVHFDFSFCIEIL